MAEVKVIPPGLGAIGQVILSDNKCYELARRTTDPVDTPVITALYSDCDDCQNNVNVTLCANSGSPVADDGCAGRCSGGVPQRLYLTITTAEGPWAAMEAHAFELVYAGNCSWYGSFSACPSGFPTPNINITLYDLGYGVWTVDVSEGSSTYFAYLTNNSGEPCDPLGSYSCEPSCVVGEAIYGTVSGTAP